MKLSDLSDYRNSKPLLPPAPGKLHFEVHYTELLDLDEADPLCPTAAIHVQGTEADAVNEAVSAHFSTYVVGRGPMPGGHSLLVSQFDYAALRAFLLPYWPRMPEAFPEPAPTAEMAGSYTQETFDVINYLAIPPEPDAGFLKPAREALRRYVPVEQQVQVLHACRWLREELKPLNNCFTLAALLARYLQALGLPAEYRCGRISLYREGRYSTEVRHAWVKLDGHTLDLTLDHQSAWHGPAPALRVLDVDTPAVHYTEDSAETIVQTERRYWRLFSKSAERLPYTEASMRLQTAFMRQLMPPKLWHARQDWLTAVRTHGILEGTYQWMLVGLTP